MLNVEIHYKIHLTEWDEEIQNKVNYFIDNLNNY